MCKAGLYIINVLNPKRSFIIGDCAFSKNQYGKPEPDMLPIASDTVVGLINNPGQIVLRLVNSDNRSDEKSMPLMLVASQEVTLLLVALKHWFVH